MITKQEAIQKKETRFLGKPCKNGHSGWRYTINSDCVECAQSRQETSARKEYESKYRKTAKYQEYQKQYQSKYICTDKYKQQKRVYAEQNKSKLTAKTRKYQAAKLNRTPDWLTPDDLWMIEQAYELAALRGHMFNFPWHVDHILPLLGRVVSGLHVPHNLQVIPAKDNQRKWNTFTVT